MTIKIEPEGVVVPAETLAPLLGVQAEAVPRLMREGAITSRLERGVGEDKGRSRMTFWYAGLRVRLTVDAAGVILDTKRDWVTP